MKKLKPNHRQFLLKETIISTFVGGLINLVITFFIFRSQEAIMLWGKGGVFFDLIPTIFFMTSGMVLGMTPSYRGRIMKGKAPAAPWPRKKHALLRLLPGPFGVRALVLGVVALILLLPVSTVLLMSLKDFPISFNEMLVFKTFYGAMIGLVFTPVIALCAMADKGGTAAQQV